jgi:hypothetical protein
MSTFETAYAQWLAAHQTARAGERFRRLVEGHSHAEQLFLEQVWYPIFQHLEDLHPEYEVGDYKEGTRFLDFAFLRAPIRLAIEIDGYGPHLSKISRWQFSDQLMRQNSLIIEGWQILRFSYDDVKERPKLCQQQLLQLMGRRMAQRGSTTTTRLNPTEKEIILHALDKKKDLRASDIMSLLEVSRYKACRILRKLHHKNILRPKGTGAKRIHRYQINTDQLSDYTL